MPFQKLQLRPGIIRDVTNYTNEGGWYDADKVRFRMGMPESIGGWEKLAEDQFLGTCRALHQWTTLSGTEYTALGTSKKLYVFNGLSYADITPLRRTVTLGTDPFATVLQTGSISTRLIVNDTGHGCLDGDFVTFSGAVAGAALVGRGVETSMLNGNFAVEVIDANNYYITLLNAGYVASNTITYTGGGAAVLAQYEIHAGQDDQSTLSGYGSGTYGRSTWSSAVPPFADSGQLRLWSLDNFGEDLVAAIRNGGIYVWDASVGTGTRAVALSDVPGANQAPTACIGIQVSEVDRHLLVFGANPRGSSTQDLLLVRWSGQENLLEWEPRRNTTAGGQRISSGSQILGWSRGRQETVVFSDIGLNSITFNGPPYVFGVIGTAQNVSIISQNAIAEARNQLYWMDLNAFRFYNGSVNALPCTVQAYVFDDFNLAQRGKVCAGNNGRFNEIWWFYPSASSSENDRYVTYNYVDNIWSIGSMVRTAWLDPSFSGYPIAADLGYLYTHEIGFNADGAALNSYIEGSDLALADGDQFVFISRIAPDFTQLGTNPSGQITYQIKSRDFPQSTQATGFSGALVSTSYPKELFVRVRTRQFALRVSSSETNLGWRLGTTRFDMQTDGRKQ